MRHAVPVLLVLLLSLNSGCGGEGTPAAKPAWDFGPPMSNATGVAAAEKLKGIYPVGSRIVDGKSSGGFGPCDNHSRPLKNSAWGANGSVSLIAFPDESVAYFTHQGIAVRLVNRTAAVVSFRACDSCLFLVREALDQAGRWQEIETLPEPICGRSFHQVGLEAGYYWQFPARLYDGEIKTKLRFRLDRGKNEAPVYSNELEGQIATAQLQ